MTTGKAVWALCEHRQGCVRAMSQGPPLGGSGSGQGCSGLSPIPLGRHRSFSDDVNPWMERFSSSRATQPTQQYVVFASPPFEALALDLQRQHPSRFRFFPIHWHKFPDGTDNITITGFTPRNFVSGSHCLFLASFHNNDVTLSQFSVLIVLLQSFIEVNSLINSLFHFYFNFNFTFFFFQHI